MTLISTRQQLRPRGGLHCLLLFDERRVRLDPSIVARTGFWLSFFRFQGATSHTTYVGGAKYTTRISPGPAAKTSRLRDTYPISALRSRANRVTAVSDWEDQCSNCHRTDCAFRLIFWMSGAPVSSTAHGASFDCLVRVGRALDQRLHENPLHFDNSARTSSPGSMVRGFSEGAGSRCGSALPTIRVSPARAQTIRPCDAGAATATVTRSANRRHSLGRSPGTRNVLYSAPTSKTTPRVIRTSSSKEVAKT